MTYRWLKWSSDKWFSRQGTVVPFDKIEHAVGSAALAVLLMIFFPVAWACLIAFVLGILWEIKDGFLHWEKYSWWGGEGFSWKDLSADFVGVATVFAPIFCYGLEYGV